MFAKLVFYFLRNLLNCLLQRQKTN